MIAPVFVAVKATLMFPTRDRPETDKPDTVCIYKHSPSDVALQIRLPKHIAHVTLTCGELREVIEALQAAEQEIQS